MEAGISRSEIVRPGTARWESGLLLGSALFLVLFTSLYTGLFGRQQVEAELADWQLSAYSDLQGDEQALANELLLAGEEIYLMHLYNGRWPTIEDFQEIYLPPFYRDAAWRQRGELDWQWRDLSPAGDASRGLALYHGSGGLLPGQAAWLLLVDHAHSGTQQSRSITLWRHPDSQAGLPEETAPVSLVREGWRQVLPYQGSDESRRLED